MTAADAIVVGGGVAGCVVATRLAESGRRVVLVEAGPGEPRPASVSGLDTVAASQEASRLWSNCEIVDRPGLPGRPYRQGFGLGGGSMVNSLVLSPGDTDCYERWRSVNGCDWGAEDMAPWLDLATETLPGEPATVGSLGLAFSDAAVAAGHRSGGSSMDRDRAGVMGAWLAKSDDRRRSTVDAYRLLPEESDLGYEPPTVRTDSAVSSVLIDGDLRATGVELATGERIDAPLVVTCAGAIQSPALLIRSGLVARPVGAGLKDHPSFAFTVARKPSRGPSAESPADRAVSTVLRWSSGIDDGLDLQAIVIDRVDSPNDRASRADDRPGFAVVVVGLMTVESSGSVAIADGSRDRVVATTGALSSQNDRLRLRSGVLAIEELLRRPELAAIVDEIYVDDIGTPSSALSAMDADELDSWIAGHPGPYAHPACSCPMGPPERETSVVSGRAGGLGRLLGYGGLYVADASIMPDLVNGGLQLPVAATAERIAAELIDQHR